MKKATACIIAHLFFVLLTQATGIYELKFSSKFRGITTHYDGLLKFFNDSSSDNKLRVIYTNQNGRTIIVEETIKVEIDSRWSAGEYRVLKGYNPVIIDNGGDEYEEYSADIFLFKKSQSGFFEPDKIISVVEGDHVEGRFELFKPVTTKRVYRNAFKKYFSERFFSEIVTDSMAGNGKDLIPAGPPVNSAVTKIHLVLVSNTDDPTLGKSCKKNEKDIEYFYRTVAKLLGCEFDIKKINGTKLKKSEVDSKISSLNVKSTEAVFFYFSGHGFRKINSNDPFPELDLRTDVLGDFPSEYNSASLSSIYTTLIDKKPALLVVMGECCNKLLSNQTAMMVQERPVAIAPAPVPLEPGQVKKLFEKNDKVIVGTASPDQFSYYYLENGGVFWNQLYDIMVEHLGLGSSTKTDIHLLSWKTIIEKAGNKTNNAVKLVHSDYTEIPILKHAGL